MSSKNKYNFETKSNSSSYTTRNFSYPITISKHLNENDDLILSCDNNLSFSLYEEEVGIFYERKGKNNYIFIY